MFRFTLLTFFVAFSALAQEPVPHTGNNLFPEITEASDDRNEMTDAEYLTVLMKSLQVDLKDSFTREFQDERLTEVLRKMKTDSAQVLEALAEKEPKFRPLVDKLQENKINLANVTVFTCENKTEKNWGKYVVVASPSKKREKGITLHIVPLVEPVMDPKQPEGAKTTIAIARAADAGVDNLRIGSHPKVGETIELRITYEQAKAFDTFIVGRSSPMVPLLHDDRATMCKLPTFK